MKSLLPKILLWLLVINLGIAFGAGLYEARIEFPQWLTYSTETGYRWDPQAAREANTGLRFWVYVTTVPLTLITLANLIAGWLDRSEIRAWWLSAAVTALADRVFTFAYFVPTMLKLMNTDTLSQTEAVDMASTWGQLNSLRHVIVLVAWLLALKAFSMLETGRLNARLEKGPSAQRTTDKFDRISQFSTLCSRIETRTDRLTRHR